MTPSGEEIMGEADERDFEEAAAFDSGSDGHIAISTTAIRTTAMASIPATCHREKRGSGSGT